MTKKKAFVKVKLAASVGPAQCHTPDCGAVPPGDAICTPVNIIFLSDSLSDFKLGFWASGER
jgi:hypothetical protein